MAMKVDIRVPVGLPVADTAEFIAGCEGAGFSGVGVHDHQHSGRDVFLTLALAAQRTSMLNLHAQPLSRHYEPGHPAPRRIGIISSHPRRDCSGKGITDGGARVSGGWKHRSSKCVCRTDAAGRTIHKAAALGRTRDVQRYRDQTQEC